MKKILLVSVFLSLLLTVASCSPGDEYEYPPRGRRDRPVRDVGHDDVHRPHRAPALYGDSIP